MSGTLRVTSAAGAESSETGYWVAVQRGPYVAILFGVDFGNVRTSRSAIEALTEKASARLAP